MNLLLSGYLGRMGQVVREVASSGYRGANVLCGVDLNAKGTEAVICRNRFRNLPRVDCILDFSHHSLTKPLLDYAVTQGTPLVIATTGQDDGEKELIRIASKKIPIFLSANYSLGIALLIETAVTVAKAMPEAEIEIAETHHNGKVDAPSGTAFAIAEALKKEARPNAVFHLGRNGMGKRTHEEIGIHAIRMGNTVGIHEVIIGTDSQTLTLKHEAHDRKVLAEGALTAADYLIGKSAGLYGMKNLLNDRKDATL